MSYDRVAKQNYYSPTEGSSPKIEPTSYSWKDKTVSQIKSSLYDASIALPVMLVYEASFLMLHKAPLGQVEVLLKPLAIPIALSAIFGMIAGATDDEKTDKQMAIKGVAIGLITVSKLILAGNVISSGISPLAYYAICVASSVSGYTLTQLWKRSISS